MKKCVCHPNDLAPFGDCICGADKEETPEHLKQEKEDPMLTGDSSNILGPILCCIILVSIGALVIFAGYRKNRAIKSNSATTHCTGYTVIDSNRVVWCTGDTIVYERLKNVRIWKSQKN